MTPTTDKSSVKDVVKCIVNQVTVESGRMVARIITDNKSEYVNEELRSWLAGRGILHSVSAPYTPQQNGTSERAIRAIKEGARTQLIRSKLPTFLWAEAAAATVYALNRAPSRRDKLKSRYEIYYGYKPDVGNLRVFGQMAVVKDNDSKLSKWGSQVRILPFVNYTDIIPIGFTWLVNVE